MGVDVGAVLLLTLVLPLLFFVVDSACCRSLFRSCKIFLVAAAAAVLAKTADTNRGVAGGRRATIEPTAGVPALRHLNAGALGKTPNTTACCDSLVSVVIAHAPQHASWLPANDVSFLNTIWKKCMQ